MESWYPVQNLCLCAVSVMCFLHGYILLVILSEILKFKIHGKRSVKGCINVSWHIKTIVEVEKWLLYFNVYSHSTYCLLSFLFSFFLFVFFCSKHDLEDMFKFMDVMQGSYTVLAHVGGPLCPKYMHTGCKLKATEWKLVWILFISFV